MTNAQSKENIFIDSLLFLHFEIPMIQSHHKRIAIIGCAGSGKTTLAFQLQKQLNLPLYHLDQYYWKPGWQRSELEEFSKIHTQLCKQNAWIMEGSYYKTFHERAVHADVIIFLDAPRYKCIWFVLKRSVLNLGKIIPGSPKACKQELLNFKYVEFLHWIWTFNKRYKEGILQELEAHKKTKQIYIVQSFKEIEKFLPSML